VRGILRRGRLPAGDGPAVVLLGLLVVVWIALGLWICRRAPYGSGTDESIRYVAFAAAEHRWAEVEDFRAYGVDHFYYPPLYYLLFAPFHRREEVFLGGYPRGPESDENYRLNRGGTQLVSPAFLGRVPPRLVGLYREAKLVSLGCGLAVLLCLIATLALAFPGPGRWWLVLAGTVPCLTLPEFLYYQTLVNNDVLVNALCALATLAFVAGVRSCRERREQGFRAWTAVCAAAAGLGLLTKQSALAVLPLVAGLVLAPLLRRDGETPGRRRVVPVLRHALLSAGIVLASGGWWLVRGALRGDPFGMQAQFLAHPWVTSGPGRLTAFYAEQFLTRIARSYVALFSGALWGVPDRIFVAYLAVPAVVAVAVVAAAVARRVRRGRARQAVRPSDPFRAWTLGFLAATPLLNLLLVIAYNLRIVAPYGRLLFPSLVALHVLFAGLVGWLAAGRPRVVACAAAALLLSLGGLFLWTFRHRMVPAVIQAPEHLVALAAEDPESWRVSPVKPIWKHEVAQPLTLPPGRLRSLRVRIQRVSVYPQFGAEIRGRLEVVGGGGTLGEIALLPVPLGDTDAADRWTDLELARPLDLQAPAKALLTLRATPPWLVRGPRFNATYGMGPPVGTYPLGVLLVDGEPWGQHLSLSAVYE
jgi:hypothetical protein